MLSSFAWAMAAAMIRLLSASEIAMFCLLCAIGLGPLISATS